MATRGEISFEPDLNKFDILLTAPSFSLSGPTMKPGVSTNETIGMFLSLHKSKKSETLSADSESTAPPRCLQSLAMKAAACPSIRIKPVTIAFP